MMRSNPLVKEVLTGHGRPGPPHLAQLNYLCIQALVLVLWWPKDSMLRTLETGKEPIALLALMIAVGATVAYYAVRAGAEELLLSGQHPLREWVLATPLGLGRILRGYLAGHFVQTVYSIVLSAPLLCAAFTVFRGTWPSLAWCLVAALAQAASYRLAAACVYATVGHHRNTTFISIRAVLLAGYILTSAFLPALSHPALCVRLLRTGNEAANVFIAGVVVPDYLVFLLLYTVLTAALWGALSQFLRRQRRQALAAAPPMPELGSGDHSVRTVR